MPNEATDLEERIDAACDDFETAWNHEPPRIEDFINRFAPPEQNAVAPTLVALEMEFLLRSQSCEPVRVENYLLRFPGLFSSSAVADLVLREFRYRQQWGDRPHLQEVLKRFESIAEEIETPMRRYAAHVTPTDLSVYRDGARQFNFRIETAVIIGRQIGNEPPPFCVIPGSDAAAFDRLIVGDTSKRSISRRAASIEIVAKERVELTNLSGAPLSIEMHDPVSPGETRPIDRPIIVLFPDSVSLRISPLHER